MSARFVGGTRCSEHAAGETSRIVMNHMGHHGRAGPQRSVVGMAERLYLERRSGIFTIWLAGPLNEPKERVAMLCGCGGEVTESFMTEGCGESCKACRQVVQERSQPKPTRRTARREHLEMSSTMIVNGW